MTKNGPWNILASKTMYQNPHIRVVEDQVTQPDGKPGAYATVQMKTGVCVLPIDGDGSIYLTRQFRYALGSVNHLFLARDLTFTQTKREGTEMIQAVKLTMEEALEKVMEGEIVHAISGLMILKARRYLAEEKERIR